MSIEKSILKTLQEADEKIEKASALEASAITIQKSATKLRDESERNLAKVREERGIFDRLRNEWQAETAKKEDELKNREKTLAAGKADLERKSAEKNKELTTREEALNAREIGLNNNEQANRAQNVMLNDRAAKYKSIADFINKNL